MPKYRVKKLEKHTYIVTYEVTAASKEDADKAIENGEGIETDEEYVEREEISTEEINEL